MRPQNQHVRERLNTELRRHAPTSAIILADRLDVSVPTIHRMLRERNEQIVRQGTTKNARYALRRPLRGKIHPIPVYGIDANGHGHAIGNLDLIAPEGALLDLLIMGWPSSTNHQ